jgi:hypothetical protein
MRIEPGACNDGEASLTPPRDEAAFEPGGRAVGRAVPEEISIFHDDWAIDLVRCGGGVRG